MLRNTTQLYTCSCSAVVSDIVSSLVIVDCIASATVVGLTPSIGVVGTLPTGISETGDHWGTIRANIRPCYREDKADYCDSTIHTMVCRHVRGKYNMPSKVFIM